MHRWILGAGLRRPPALAVLAAVLLAACGSAAAAACRVAVERFIAADCSDCWAREEAPAAARFDLDWILPAQPESPLEAAALVEAAERRERAGTPPPAPGTAAAREQAIKPAPGLRLSVDIGPAWHGYMGLRFTVNGRPPKGSMGYLALVEALPAGSEGNASARTLVRALAGPLNLAGARPGRSFTHLQSMRWPETARPERLQPRGWIEAPDGRILAVAGAPCDHVR